MSLRIGTVDEYSHRRAMKDARSKSHRWNKTHVVESVKEIKSGSKKGLWAVYGHGRKREK